MHQYDKIILDDGVYVHDYRYRLPTEIIEIISPQSYVPSTQNRIYRFGYQFKSSASTQQRTDFINFVLGKGKNMISDRHLVQFIEYPLGELDQRINIYHLDCLVYPGFETSKPAKKTVSVINSCTSREIRRVSYEFVEDALENLDNTTRIQGKNILIIEDINASESDVSGIMRILDQLNNDCNIYVYTLFFNIKSE